MATRAAPTERRNLALTRRNEAKPRNADLDKWLAKAKEHPGSWWPDWLAWLKRQDRAEVAARVPGDGALKPIENAPGSYVKVRD